MRDRAIGLFFIIFGCGLAAPIRSPVPGRRTKADNSAAVELSVAAPEELNPAITEVAESFEQKTGNRVRLTFGDSASLYSQIRNGARFDAFLDGHGPPPAPRGLRHGDRWLFNGIRSG